MKVMKRVRPPLEPWSFGSGLIVGCFLVLSMTYVMMSTEISMDHLGILNCLPSPSPSRSPLSNAAAATSFVARQMIQESGFVEEELEESAREMKSIRIEQAKTIAKTVNANEKKPEMCDFSAFRFNVCDLEGDVRIVGKNLSSTVTLVNSGSSGNAGSWQIKPYPRKYDRSAMAKVRTLNLTASSATAPSCTVNHSVPAVVFSTGGHCGNCFHDFADVLIPLFETVAPFRGKVRFVIASRQGWWMHKYRPYLARLSAYDVIDLDNDAGVHCFPRVIVGLRAGRDLLIDPTAKKSAGAGPPGNSSIADFVALTRSAYGLPRERVETGSGKQKKQKKKRPRILFIARGWTRRFENMEAVRRVAEAVGFEVVVAEPDFFDVARFARVVNSCDVMVGVHGAGLTNFLFLPTGAVVVQVVPLGKLDWIATNFYAEPAMGRGLQYLQYDISVEESTLIDLYPRDHQVFTDPDAIHRDGWNKLGDVYLKQQSVRIDATRFRPVLQKAIEHLPRVEQ